MGAKETDLNPDAFVGIQFPLDIGNQGYFKQTKTLLDQSPHNLKNLLLTIKGERVAQPEFGSDLYNILFEPIDTDGGIDENLESTIREAVDIWLPYIIIENVIVEINKKNEISINIHFTTSLNPNQNNSLSLTVQKYPHQL